MRALTRAFRPAAVLSVMSLMAGASAHAQEPRSAVLSDAARDAMCAPLPQANGPATRMSIVGGRELRKTLFGTGDTVVVNGGSAQGVRPGEDYVIRRVVHDRFVEPSSGWEPATVQTAGMLRIVDALVDVSVATVSYACDGVSEGDYLERYEAAALPAPAPGTSPDFSSPGRVILGAERRQIAAAGDFMMLDRGRAHGIQPGQRVTVFRTAAGAGGPITSIGTARVYVVLPATSTIRIERSVDAVYVGDLVAVHR